MSQAENQPSRLLDKVIIPAAQTLAFVVGLAVVFPPEFNRLFDASRSETGPAGWLFNWNIDTTPWVFVFLCLPIAWTLKSRPRKPSNDDNKRSWLNATPAKLQTGHSKTPVIVMATCVAALAFAMHMRIGFTDVSSRKPDSKSSAVRFKDLPPAYHDEYSYLFQARTFQRGRLSQPSPEFMPQMFDQMHVLNEGKMASRYFPGVGAWLAPWDAFEMVVVGQWFAAALAAVFVFLSGREIGGNATGLLSGILFAVSPGIGLFGNLLLAHHPTLFALCVFLFAYLKFRNTLSNRWAFVAGTALVFAMLCRPMTAAGFGLPFGLHLFWVSFGKVYHTKTAKPLAGLCWMGLPIACGFAFLFFYNHAITGNAFQTPYQVYTDIYSPRHVYGFNNVVRGEQKLGEKVIENYDTWAKNLDWPLAINNVFNRLIASMQWTVALVPLSMSLMAAVLLFPFVRNGFRLVMLAFVSLHIAHIPYWFDGIMHWHYVFETAPLLCLICGTVMVQFAVWWRKTGRGKMVWWGLMVICVSFVPVFFSVEMFWPTPRLDAGISEVAFSRKRYAAFHERIRPFLKRNQMTKGSASNSTDPDPKAETETKKTDGETKLLILVIPDPNDRHIDYVLNNPGLNDQIIIARADAAFLSDRNKDGKSTIARIVEHYSDRECILFNAKTQRIISLE